VEVLELTRSLVAIDSQNPGPLEPEIAGFVLDWARQRGFATETIELREGRPNIVVTADRGAGPRLGLSGHLDTKPVGDARPLWDTDPLELTVVGDLAYGLGSTDMKGGVTSFIAAAGILDDLGVTLKGDLMLNTSIGEEDGGVGALSTVLRGYKPDAVVITEPTDLRLMVAHGGSLVFRITVHGKSAHGGTRMEGVSAFEKFIPIFQDLMAWERERNETLSHPLYDHMENKFPISVGVVKAGEWASTVPDTLIAEGRLGFLPGETIEGMMQQAEERIAAVAAADPWMKDHPPTVEWFGGQFASAEISPDAPIAQAVRAAHASVTGAEPEIIAYSAGTDMRLFTEIGHIPTCVYGAGNVHLAHQPEEYIEIPELLTAVEVLTRLIIDWCGIADGWQPGEDSTR